MPSLGALCTPPSQAGLFQVTCVPGGHCLPPPWPAPPSGHQVPPPPSSTCPHGPQVCRNPCGVFPIHHGNPSLLSATPTPSTRGQWLRQSPGHRPLKGLPLPQPVVVWTGDVEVGATPRAHPACCVSRQVLAVSGQPGLSSPNIEEIFPVLESGWCLPTSQKPLPCWPTDVPELGHVGFRIPRGGIQPQTGRLAARSLWGRAVPRGLPAGPWAHWIMG